MLDALWPQTFFEIGAAGPIRCRREAVAVGLPRPVRVLYASDLHLGNRWSRHVVQGVVDIVHRERPDVVLHGGDLADSHAGIRPLSALLEAVAPLAPLAAVLGNHDRWNQGRTIRATLDAANVWPLDQSPIVIAGLHIVGRLDQVREPASTLLCAHDPAVYPAARQAGVRLTLAGHLHGGQCVLLNAGNRQWPGAMINRWTLTRRDDERSTLIVSRGVADTLPVRFNCPREVVLVEAI